MTQLVEANGALEVLEPVLPEIAERLGIEECGGRRRHEDLLAVRERRDARSAVNIQSHVPLARYRGDARVQPHAHADRALRESLQRDLRRGGSPCGGGEGNEERVPLGIHLDAAAS